MLSFIDTNKDLTVATDTISAIKSQSNKNHNANKKIIILKKVQKTVHNIFKYVMYKAWPTFKGNKYLFFFSSYQFFANYNKLRVVVKNKSRLKPRLREIADFAVALFPRKRKKSGSKRNLGKTGRTRSCSDIGHWHHRPLLDEINSVTNCNLSSSEDSDLIRDFFQISSCYTNLSFVISNN